MMTPTLLVRSFAAGAAFTLIASSATFAADAVLEGAEPGKWTMDYGAAMDLAKEKNLPIMLYFTGSDWCPPCQMMDQTVFSNPAWDSFTDGKLLLVVLDFPRFTNTVPRKLMFRNTQLQREYQVRGFPTFVMLDSDGSELDRLNVPADVTTESFIADIESVLRFTSSSIAAKMAELGEEKGAEYQAALEALKNAEGALETWIRTRPRQTQENIAKFHSFQDSIAAAREKVQSF